jgi:DNA-binding helix-hairpin-helix protein with protein kinase domain
LPGSEAKFELEGPNGRVVCVAGELIGTGRAASVFEVVDPPMARSLVLKLFNVRPIDPNVGEIINLVDERGLDEIAPIGVDEDRAFPVVAAPKCLVYAEGGNEPIGIAVLRVDSDRFKPLNVVLNTGRVKRDLRYGTTIALHLADLVNQIHSRGFVIGDISGTNLMADSDGFCTIVDVDSFGAERGDGLPIINAGFATSNFIAPDLHDGHATEASDRFVIACLILQLFLHGMHPFGGVQTGVDQSSIQENMSKGRSWLFDRESFILPRPFHAFMSMESLPPAMRRMARMALRTSDRPSAEDWLTAVIAAREQIRHCGACGEQKFQEGTCWSCGFGGTEGPYQILPEPDPEPVPDVTSEGTDTQQQGVADDDEAGFWAKRKKRRA